MVTAAIRPLLGAERIGRLFWAIARRAVHPAQLGYVNGEPAILRFQGDRLHSVTTIEVVDGRIANSVLNPENCRRLSRTATLRRPDEGGVAAVEPRCPITPPRVPYTRLAAEAFKGLLATSQAVHDSSIDPTLMELVFLRVSQLNGCGYCMDMHGTAAQGRHRAAQAGHPARLARKPLLRCARTCGAGPRR